MMLRYLAVAAFAVLAACSSDSSEATDARDASSVTSKPESDASSSSSSSGGTSSSSSGDPPAAERPVDACMLQTTCNAPTVSEGSGLAAVDRCGFSLEESAGIDAPSDVITSLEKIATPASVDDVLADANREATQTSAVPGGPAGVQYAFKWQEDDGNSIAWTPQGITGTADANETGKVGARSAVLVSFYDHPPEGEENMGVRIAFVDTTTATAPKYRFVLLVAPKGTTDAPSFDPIKIHAGGIVWYRDYLYVADTSKGFRVFDLRHLMKVAVDPGAFGCTGGTCRAGNYKYVLPQVGNYAVKSSCAPLFSWVSLDRKSDPPSLVSGEYCNTEACGGKPFAGRMYRWPLDATTGRLRSKVTFPTEAFVMSHKQVQGGAFVGDVAYLSSSAPTGDGGDLYRVSKTKSATSNWSNNPEDLMVDHASNWLWSLSEKAGTRSVYAVKLTSHPAP